MPPNQPGPWGPGGQGFGGQGPGTGPGFGPGFGPQQPGQSPQPQWGGPWGPAGAPGAPGAPPPPPQKNGLKWLLGGVAVLLVIAISVGVTLLVTRDGSGGGESTETSTPGGPPVASADDDGPVEIITFEPTCADWKQISRSVGQIQSQNWQDRDPDLPATQWTTEQRTKNEAVAKSLQQSADQAVSLGRQTPNRVIREFYEQFIAYSRAFAVHISEYTPDDNYLALASIASTYVLDSVCDSIAYGSATSRSASVKGYQNSDSSGPVGDVADPSRFISKSDEGCQALIARREELIDATKQWSEQDPNVPATQWTAEQRSIYEAVAPVLTAFADDIELAANKNSNSTFRDFAGFAAIYVRAYVSAIPTYVPADNYLFVAGSRANNLIINACRAASG